MKNFLETCWGWIKSSVTTFFCIAIGLSAGQFITLGDHFRPELRPDYSWIENLPPATRILHEQGTLVAKKEKVDFEKAVKLLDDGSLQKKLQGAVGK
jgi:hypothetical protein